MRGKVKPVLWAVRITGITPAYAGKSQNGAGCIRAEKDHPRLCGEKGRVAAGVIVVSGSPPPMRGKVLFQILDEASFGITPAYAGKSGTAARRSFWRRITPAYAGKSRR